MSLYAASMRFVTECGLPARERRHVHINRAIHDPKGTGAEKLDELITATVDDTASEVGHRLIAVRHGVKNDEATKSRRCAMMQMSPAKQGSTDLCRGLLWAFMLSQSTHPCPVASVKGARNVPIRLSGVRTPCPYPTFWSVSQRKLV